MWAWLILLSSIAGAGDGSPGSEQAYHITYRDGRAERLTVLYTPRLEVSTRELGRTPPGKSPSSGGQRCQWDVNVSIERQICQISASGEPACFARFSRLIPAEDLSLRQFRLGGCATSAARMEKDLVQLRRRASDAVPEIAWEDRQGVEQELRALPHVAQVRAGS